MKVSLVAPTLSILINLVATIAYLWEGDFRKAIYWFAGAVIIACVTF